MNFNSLRPGSSEHTSCSPSKSKPLSRQINDNNNSNQLSSDRSPTVRVTRQMSRNQQTARRQPVRRSARLARSTSRGGGGGNSLAANGNLQTRVRRSARIARFGSASTSTTSSRASSSSQRNNRQQASRRIQPQSISASTLVRRSARLRSASAAACRSG